MALRALSCVIGSMLLHMLRGVVHNPLVVVSGIVCVSVCVCGGGRSVRQRNYAYAYCHHLLYISTLPPGSANSDRVSRNRVSTPRVGGVRVGT